MAVFLKILRWIGISVAVLALIGFFYQQVGLILDAQLAPPGSAMIIVGGRKTHVVCTGKGAHTFVLDAGAGGWSSEWYRVQPLLARHGRVCSFDRAGLGWTDPSSASYDGASAAEQLRETITVAKIPTPFIYVGHSLGANFAQIYYNQHQSDVAGLVLIEPGDPKDLLELSRRSE